MVNVVVVGMPWRMTLFQISSFLRPMAAGMVALMVSSITERWFLRTEEAGVLSLVRRRTWWLVVNSIVAIRGFLIAELMELRMVRALVLSGRDYGTVAFGQNRRGRLLVWQVGRGFGGE